MFKWKRKPGQLIGSDLDWFVIPIRTIRLWGIVIALVIAAGFVSFGVRSKSRQSPQDRAQREIATAADLVSRASAAARAARAGADGSQARDLLQGARDAFGNRNYDSAFRLAVESQSYARRALGGATADEPGDASLISVEGDVAIQTAGRS